MKIAITAQGQDLNSPLDPRFGRARYLLVVDLESGDWSVQDNSVNLNALQGAGLQTAKRVVETGAKAVVTGHVGPKAFSALQAGGVKVYTGATGSVSDAVEQFKAGRLQAAASPDVEGHW